MSSVGSGRSFSHLYMMFRCPCGQELRVKRELAGSEVRCWDCHQMVPVPIPRDRGRALRDMFRATRDLLRSESVLEILGAAVLLTAVLAVPRAGVPLATIGFVVLAFGYGEWIRRSEPETDRDEEEDEDEDPALARKSARFRGAAAAALGLALSAPWLLSRGGFGNAPRATPIGATLALVAALVLPLVMLAAFARGASGPLGFAGVRQVARRHPLMLAASLGVVPAGFVLCELVAFGASILTGWFPYLLLDLYPGSTTLVQRVGLPIYVDYAQPTTADARFIRMYYIRLAQGYTLFEAIPGSLSLPKDMARSPWAFQSRDLSYFAYRVVYCLACLTVLFFTLCLQARWLGLMVEIDRSHLQHPPPPRPPAPAGT